MGPDWEMLMKLQAQMEAHQKKQRLKQITNKKLVDKRLIHKVVLEDECGPIITCVRTMVVPRRKLNGDMWVPVD